MVKKNYEQPRIYITNYLSGLCPDVQVRCTEILLLRPSCALRAPHKVVLESLSESWTFISTGKTVQGWSQELLKSMR